MSIMENNQKPFPQSGRLVGGEKTSRRRIWNDGETTAIR
jgi:hypothetical protein